MIEIDESSATAKVYRVTNKGVYLVKVHLSDIDTHISAITVQKSKYPTKPLWVQLPRYQPDPPYGDWVFPVECSTSSPLKGLIDKLAVQAVEEYKLKADTGGQDTGLDRIVEPNAKELENMDEVVGKAVDDFLSEEPP